ncbi:MAG: GFA family protein [Pseudomonadota bacterium]
MAERSTGQCLCGAIRITCTLRDGNVQACHCGQCQRWTGGGPLYAVRVDDLTIEGEAAISTYRASAHGERAFCGTCGTTLYWRMQGRPVAFIAPGLLDDGADLTLTEEIFVDARPDWLPANPHAAQSTEAEELAKLHAFLEGETR